MAQAIVPATPADSLTNLLTHGLRVVPDSSWNRMLHPSASTWSAERLLTLFGLVVVPLAAAWVGARIGGRETRRIALETFQLQQKAEAARARTRLVHYLRRSLDGTHAMALALSQISTTNDAPWRGVARELLAMWDEYDRLAVDLYLLGPYNFGIKYHTFVINLKLVVRTTLASEGDFDSIAAEPHPRDAVQSARHDVIRRTTRATRESFLEAARGWAVAAPELAGLLRASNEEAIVDDQAPGSTL